MRHFKRCRERLSVIIRRRRSRRQRDDRSPAPLITVKVTCYLHSEAASNLSDFFFRFHFHGLKSLPRAENLLFLSKGGVRAPEPKLFVRNAAPFCFFAATTKGNFTLICIRYNTRAFYEMRVKIARGSRPTLVTSFLLANDTRG